MVFFRQELSSCPHGHICDVIGVVIFIGRSERVRGQGKMYNTCRKTNVEVIYISSVHKCLSTLLADGQRSELEEYRWLQLEDGTSDRPIMIKLFSTSQPDIQNRIYPSNHSLPLLSMCHLRLWFLHITV